MENTNLLHCSYIKDITENLSCFGCGQIFTRRSGLNKHECTGPDSVYLFNETEVKKIESSYERGFYGCVNKSSQIASKYMEYRSKQTGKHIHHTYCGHGGERTIKVNGKDVFVDGYEPETKKVYQFHGCWYHGHMSFVKKIDPS